MFPLTRIPCKERSKKAAAPIYLVGIVLTKLHLPGF